MDCLLLAGLEQGIVAARQKNDLCSGFITIEKPEMILRQSGTGSAYIGSSRQWVSGNRLGPLCKFNGGCDEKKNK